MKFTIAALLGASVSAIQFGGGYGLNGGYGSGGSLRELDGGVRRYNGLGELSSSYNGYGDLEELDGGYGSRGGYGGYGQLDGSFGGSYGGSYGGGRGGLQEIGGGYDLEELDGLSKKYRARETFGLGDEYGYGQGGYGRDYGYG